jgi:hypothetical protein
MQVKVLTRSLASEWLVGAFSMELSISSRLVSMDIREVFVEGEVVGLLVNVLTTVYNYKGQTVRYVMNSDLQYLIKCLR